MYAKQTIFLVISVEISTGWLILNGAIWTMWTTVYYDLILTVAYWIELNCDKMISFLGKRTKTTSHFLQKVQMPQIAQSDTIQEV